VILVAVYTIAAAVAAATLLGAIRLLDRRHRAADETEADAPANGGDTPQSPGATPGEAPAPRLEVLVRRRVGFGQSLVVVEVEGRRLLLGSTRGAWTALAELGTAPAAPAPPARPDAIEAELRRAYNASRFRRGGRSR